MGIYDPLSEAHRERLPALLLDKDASGTTKYNRLKQSVKAPTWTHFQCFCSRPAIRSSGALRITDRGSPAAGIDPPDTAEGPERSASRR